MDQEAFNANVDTQWLSHEVTTFNMAGCWE
jgi:hypothetical protein